MLFPIGKNDDNLLGCSSLVNNTGLVKTLAFSDQLSKDLHSLVKEALISLETSPNTLSGLVNKVLFDTLDSLNPRHLTALLLSDLDLYRDLHRIVKLNDITHVEQNPQSQSVQHSHSSIEHPLILSAEEVIQVDDRSLYTNEQLRNINMYYFSPYLDTAIPYKEAVREVVEEKREVMNELIERWNQIRDQLHQ
jgi:hypothetical protein